MAFIVKGIGDSANRINEITPRMDAEILRFLSQHAPGVWRTGVATNHFGLGVNQANLSVTVWMGIAQAFGYFAMSENTRNFNFVRPASGTQFARIFAEINLSRVPNEFRIGVTPQSTISNIALTQNDLSTVPNGIYQIPLYLITITSEGVLSFTDQRPWMERPQNVNHALNANDAIRATQLVAGGTINTSVTAVTQAAGTNNTRVATTAFVRTALNNALIRNLGGAIWAGRWVSPDGVIVIWGEHHVQNITFPWAFPNGCIFVGFVGSWTDDNHGLTADNHTARTTGIRRSTVTRTGFRWYHQSSAIRVNQRRYLAIGW